MSKQQLSAFVDGALSGVSRELVTRHLAACHSCREKHTAWKAADEALRGALAWTPSERTLEEWSSRVELCLTAERKGLPVPEFTPTLLPVIAPASSSAMLRMRELLEDARAKRVIASESAPAIEPARDEVAPPEAAQVPVADEPGERASEPVAEPVRDEVVSPEAAEAPVADEPAESAPEPVAEPVRDEVAEAEPAEAATAEESVASAPEPIAEPVAEDAAEAEPGIAPVAEEPVTNTPEPIAEPVLDEVAEEQPVETPLPEEPVVSAPEPIAEPVSEDAAETEPAAAAAAEESVASTPEPIAEPVREEVEEAQPAESSIVEEPVANESEPDNEPAFDEAEETEEADEAEEPPRVGPSGSIVLESIEPAARAGATASDSQLARPRVAPILATPEAVRSVEPPPATSREPVPAPVAHVAPARVPEPTPSPTHSARPAREPAMESSAPAPRLVTSHDLSTFAGSSESKPDPAQVAGAAEHAPRLARVPKPAPRPALRPSRPNGVRQLVVACAVLALVLATSVFMPEVIRIPIPESWLPRMPRVEFVRRGTHASDEPARTPEPAVRTAAREPVLPELVPQRPTAPEGLAPAKGDTASARDTAAAIGPDSFTPSERASVPDATPGGAPARPAPGAVASGAPSTPQRTTPTPARTANRPAPTSGASEDKPTYVPDQPATIIPTKVSTSVRLSSPPARKASEPERDEQWPLLCGEVRDLNDKPLEGALVELISPSLTVRTDRRGRFCVACPPGTRSLRVQAHGFRITERTIQLADSMVETHISLQPLR